MGLTINNPVTGGGATTIFANKTTANHHQFPPSFLFFSSKITPSHIVGATGKFKSKTGKFDSKNKKTSVTTTDYEQTPQIFTNFDNNYSEVFDDDVNGVDDGFVLSDLPGLQKDFWEGPQWDGFGFFVQYMWAFGVVFALVACGVAVATYNEGATDFRQTPAYKESVQSKDLLEGPEASDSDVFESNPTEVAPALE